MVVIDEPSSHWGLSIKDRLAYLSVVVNTGLPICSLSLWKVCSCHGRHCSLDYATPVPSVTSPTPSHLSPRF